MDMDKDELKKKLLENETAVLQDDGTELPYTGKHLCINSCSIDLKKEEENI